MGQDDGPSEIPLADWPTQRDIAGIGHVRAVARTPPPCRDARPIGARERLYQELGASWRLQPTADSAQEAKWVPLAGAKPSAWLAKSVRSLHRRPGESATEYSERYRGVMLRPGEFDTLTAWYDPTDLPDDLIESLREIESEKPSPQQEATVTEHQLVTAPTVTVESDEPGEVVLDVTTERATLLVLCQENLPGWRALIERDGDEADAPIITVNYVMQGVVAKAGSFTRRISLSTMESRGGCSHLASNLGVGLGMCVENKSAGLDQRRRRRPCGDVVDRSPHRVIEANGTHSLAQRAYILRSQRCARCAIQARGASQ